MARTTILDRTAAAVARIAEEAVFSESFALRKGLLQRIDVRAKLLSGAIVLVTASVLRGPGPLWTLYGASLLLALLSGVPLLPFLKRVWLFVPLFTAALVLPALLNVVTPGDPLWVVLHLDREYAWGPYRVPREIAVTRQGAWGFVLLVSRVAVSVSFTVLFTLTTRWSAIFPGLRALRVPRVVVLTMSMTYRYLFLLLRLVQDLGMARRSRTIGKSGRASERSWIASRMGFLFRRSRQLGGHVYLAMLSRGFQGDALMFSPPRFRSADTAWTVCSLAFALFLIAIDRGAAL